jgi:anti-sigma factor RsiW
VTHQPYERWLLGDEPLSSAERAELENHLVGCQACRELWQAWAAVESALQATLDVEPTPGFTARWRQVQIRRSVSDSRRQRRAGALALAGGLSVAALIAVGLLRQGVQALFTPATLATRQLEIVLILARHLRLLGDLALTGAQALAGVIPLEVWLTVLVIGATAVALWFLALYRLAFQRIR